MTKVSLWQRITRRFSASCYISYSRTDGLPYAESLADNLVKAGRTLHLADYKVFLKI
jgi:hypothetical protein